jgi:hypothetical protein
MTNAIKVLLQMPSGFLQLESTLHKGRFRIVSKNLLIATVHTYIQLVAKKNGNCQNKMDTCLQFFHSVKPSYER